MKDIHNWDRLQQLSLMPLQRRRQRYIIIYMWKVLHGATTNNLNIQFVSRPRFGNQAKIPMIRRSASAANSSIHERSFAEMSPTLWNTMPNHLNVMSNFEHFKSQLTKFLLSVPEKPPIRGYTSPNSNSLLCWGIDREASAIWGGQMMWWLR